MGSTNMDPENIQAQLLHSEHMHFIKRDTALKKEFLLYILRILENILKDISREHTQANNNQHMRGSMHGTSYNLENMQLPFCSADSGTKVSHDIIR